MANKNKQPAELDGVYVLKLVMYALLGSLWLKIHSGDLSTGIPLPVGLVIGLLFASHEHFQIDRKVEYAVLVVAALVGLIAPYGLFIGI
jgi:hypothetical protein